MFKSFQHSQVVKVETETNLVKILIIEKRHEEGSLLARKKFYSEIEQMNKRLCDFIV